MKTIWILVTLLSVIVVSEAVIAENEESENYDGLKADNSSDPPLVSSKDLTAILGGVIFFWGSVWALGALFMVALMAKNYCIKSAEAGSDY